MTPTTTTTTTTTRKNGKPSAQGKPRMTALAMGEDLYVKAETEAKAQGISFSELVRKVLNGYFVAKDGE